MVKYNFILLVFCFLYSCIGIKQNAVLIPIEGTVEMVYYAKYFKTSYTPMYQKFRSKNKEHYFLSRSTYSNDIYEMCGDEKYKFDKKIIDKGNNSFHANPHFMDITKGIYTLPTHYGGEIYYRNTKDTIVISFHVKGKALLIDTFCDSLRKHTNKFSTYENRIQYPFVWLFSVKKTKPLTKKEIQGGNLIKSSIKEFDVFLPWESEDLDEY